MEIVTARLGQLLVQEALARMMFQGFEKEFLVGLFLTLLGRQAMALVVGQAFDRLVMLADISHDVFKGEAFGIFLAPIIERCADRLRGRETADFVTAIAAKA